MNREGTIGVAGLLAIAAAVGIGLQPGSKPGSGGKADGKGELRRSGTSSSKQKASEYQPGCSEIEDHLQELLGTEASLVPDHCYLDKAAAKPAKTSASTTNQAPKLKFIIATLPDPLHTHLSLVFDQFAGAIQEAAQDEKYDFDSSWLPWDDGEQQKVLLDDQDKAEKRRAGREEQPGILLFRKSIKCDPPPPPPVNSGNAPATSKELPPCKETPPAGAAGTKVAGQNSSVPGYRDGLIIFVVGEDATHGIHRKQFQNATRWIEQLKSFIGQEHAQAGIIGPTFSGSFPSLAELLSDDKIAKTLRPEKDGKLPVYSGSVSSDTAARWFKNQMNFQGSSESAKVELHSFVQNDDEILSLFCSYMLLEQPEFDAQKLAVISEDETAYGSSGMNEADDNKCKSEPLKLYYPRDISALRAAYQTKSLFTTSSPSGSVDTQTRNLPTDLADPAGIVHDSIRSYGGNQTPLAQEAFMLEIVAALKELHARYILLRSSNTLDQLFLCDFLHRMYPDGRIVIMSSDLLLIRERGATGLNGTLALSTYPLFPLERDWTESVSRPASDRVFSADTAEGTYVAFRLLLNAGGLNRQGPPPRGCQATPDSEEDIFLPKIACEEDPPMTDYSSPQWMLAKHSGKTSTDDARVYKGPATWLSVIGQNRFWPLAAITKDTLKAEPWFGQAEVHEEKSNGRSEVGVGEPGQTPELPVGMKLYLLGLAGLAIFHTWCCWAGSYTAKPAFRAHFASTGDWRQTSLVLTGSSLIAVVAIVSGWGCGVFFPGVYGVMRPWIALKAVVTLCLLMSAAVLAHSYSTWTLAESTAKDSIKLAHLRREFRKRNWITCGVLLAVILAAFLCFIYPIETALLLGNRVITYWRSMHLTSGVSPIMPLLAILIGLYLVVWYALHALALFGPDRPCLPTKERLRIEYAKGKEADFLTMFSQEDAADKIESIAMPLNRMTLMITGGLVVLFFLAAIELAGGVPLRSLGAERYSYAFFLWLDICCGLMLAKTWQFYEIWEELRRLLAFLDRLPLRRTMSVLHGFSWGSVWKMSGNVLEVRYKVISRQLECLNHTMRTLEDWQDRHSSSDEIPAIGKCLEVLEELHNTGINFAEWYSTNYKIPRAGDLTSFGTFQADVAATSGTLLVKLLLPAWRKEGESLVLALPEKGEKENATPTALPLAKYKHVQNAEEFVCLTYLAFIQNVLGRLRTLAMTIVALFIAATVAVSSYPFDPRQALSAILLVLFAVAGAVIVKVYAEMHRDSTLSHVTNTRPGELGGEFWFKIIGFGFAPAAGLLTRIFPGITDFVFSWLQPGVSSLK